MAAEDVARLRAESDALKILQEASSEQDTQGAFEVSTKSYKSVVSEHAPDVSDAVDTAFTKVGEGELSLAEIEVQLTAIDSELVGLSTEDEEEKEKGEVMHASFDTIEEEFEKAK
jgi:predicted transcriptional regulator